jgi:ribosomal protein S18 acetylase RimI-like enzyme
MIRFEPMTDNDFQMYLRKVIPEYASEYVHAGSWHPDEAMARAREQFQRIFHHGPQTPNQTLYTLWDVEKNLKIGMLWYTLDASRKRKTAFLSDFFIFMEFHRRGYEEQVLAVLEGELRAAGFERVELNLFWHNTLEREMYEKTGFTPVSVYYGKDLA